MTMNAPELIELLKKEKESAKRESFRRARRYDAIILALSENSATIKCKGGRFEIGDPIGYHRRRGDKVDIGSLGSTMEYNRKSGVLVAYLDREPPSGIEEGDRLQVFESELLMSYDLQLELLFEALSDPSEYLKRAFDATFSRLEMTELKKRPLSDLYSVNSDFRLDESQIKVVEHALSLSDGDILLIIGPPGTGKTDVIAKISKEYEMLGDKVLIASHTNRAVDNAIEKLPVDRTLRVGRPEKVLKHIHGYLLSYKVRSSLGDRLRSVELKIDEVRNELQEFWEHYGKTGISKEMREAGLEPRSSRRIRELQANLAELYEERNDMIKDESGFLVNEVGIIGSTLVKSQLYPLANVNFDIAVIDESSQASIPLILLGMSKARKWIIVGDHKQLLPIFKTIGSEYPEKLKELSAFNCLLKKYEDRKLWLRYHYRSHPEIIGFPQKYVYGNEIVSAEGLSNIVLSVKDIKRVKNRKAMEVIDPEKPTVFVHIEGEEARDGKSLYNESEVDVCIAILNALMKCGVSDEEIGIIAPYRGQRKIISERLSDGKNVEINTVDAFQGRQKDVIILSFTSTRDVKFASEPHRLNVALTRPRRKLIVIANGKPITGSEGELIHDFLRYEYENERIYDWEKGKWLTGSG